MEYCFALWVLTIKECALKESPSNEGLIRKLFHCIRSETGTTDKAGQIDWVAKETVSALVNRKIDLPRTIRSALLHYEFAGLCKALEQFYEEILTPSEAKDAVKNLAGHYTALKDKGLPDSCSDDHCALTYLLIQSARINNKLYGVKRRIYAKGNNVLNYVFDDMIAMSLSGKPAKKRTIVVIPVDAGFHFHVTKSGDKQPCVSANSIHGKWVLRLGELGVSEQEIERRVGPYPNGKIGDIAAFEYGNTLFYLLACSKFDEKNVAHATKADIKLALERLLQYHDERGQGDELVIPLIGTGNSRAKLSIIESFDLIRKTILENERWHNGVITIVAHNNAVKQVEELEKNALQN